MPHRDSRGFVRKRVVWAYAVIVKHLRWYINSSESISLERQQRMVQSLEDILRDLQIAERHDKRLRGPNEDTSWKDDLNAVRRKLGRRPVGERRLVDEFIQAILEP